jgi:hypothetical protein
MADQSYIAAEDIPYGHVCVLRDDGKAHWWTHRSDSSRPTGQLQLEVPVGVSPGVREGDVFSPLRWSERARRWNS